MQEIKCPKCGEVFQVDESGYAAIVRQVRDKEFEKELSARKAQYLSEKENAVLLAQPQTRTGRTRYQYVFSKNTGLQRFCSGGSL